MMYPILILILSFLLDGIVSHYVNLSFSSISLIKLLIQLLNS